MLTCLIVDDEQHALDVLKHHIGHCDLLELVGSTRNPFEALNLINSGKIDLLFQDIHMPDISGLDIIKTIGDRCSVVLTTAYKDYALDGYDLGVVDYLLKPIPYVRFIAAVQKVIAKREQQAPPVSNRANPGFVYVKTGLKNNVVKINFDEIEYIESLGNYVSIAHGNQKSITYMSMKSLEDILPGEKFIRVHKSYILALKKIMRVEGTEVVLTDNQMKISIGDSYKAKFWSIINERVIK